jgi:hypothetical protein
MLFRDLCPDPFPYYLLKGRGISKGGGFAPSLKISSPSPFKERGIRGVRLINNPPEVCLCPCLRL